MNSFMQIFFDRNMSYKVTVGVICASIWLNQIDEAAFSKLREILAKFIDAYSYFEVIMPFVYPLVRFNVFLIVVLVLLTFRRRAWDTERLKSVAMGIGGCALTISCLILDMPMFYGLLTKDYSPFKTLCSNLYFWVACIPLIFYTIIIIHECWYGEKGS